jgi:hypothetical protein
MSRNYDNEYKYQGTAKQIHLRSLRNQARRVMEKAGLVKKGDNKDVDHKQPLIQGGSNDRSNLRVESESENRSFPRTSDAKMR